MSIAFSDTTNKDGLVQLIEQELRLNDADISGDALYLARLTIKINKWLHITTQWIHKSAGEWAYDDHNHGNYPVETFSATNGRQDYGISSEGEKDSYIIRLVEIHDADEDADEGWSSIESAYEKDWSEDRFGQDSGTPSEYWLNGGSIIFDCPIDTSEIDKYRITKDRNAHEFTTADTDAVAGFDKKFHMLLVYGPVMEEAAILGAKDVYNNAYMQIFGDGRNFEGMKAMLEDFYANRHPAQKKKMMRKYDTYE